MTSQHTARTAIERGDLVRAIAAKLLGLSYLARVEAINGDKLRIRPERDALTAGSARSSRTRKGPSVRARWVNVSTVEFVDRCHKFCSKPSSAKRYQTWVCPECGSERPSLDDAALKAGAAS